MTTELTEQEEAQVVVYRDKWLKIGMQTEIPGQEPTLEEIAKHVNDVYVAKDLSPPKEIIIGDSPNDILHKAYEHRSDKSQSLPDFYASISFLHGNQDCNWLGYYDYLCNVLHVKECKQLMPFIELAKLSGWQLFFDTHAFISRRPVELHVNGNDQYHKDLGPALAYADGSKLFALNGVEMPEVYVMTPANLLDPNELGKIANVEIRREFVRKIGITALMDKLGATTLDESEDGMYQLVNLNLSDGRIRPYLKMLNPSINTYHVEGVPPGITTVINALAWRNGLETFTKPETLT